MRGGHEAGGDGGTSGGDGDGWRGSGMPRAVYDVVARLALPVVSELGRGVEGRENGRGEEEEEEEEEEDQNDNDVGGSHGRGRNETSTSSVGKRRSSRRQEESKRTRKILLKRGAETDAAHAGVAASKFRRGSDEGASTSSRTAAEHASWLQTSDRDISTRWKLRSIKHASPRMLEAERLSSCSAWLFAQNAVAGGNRRGELLTRLLSRSTSFSNCVRRTQHNAQVFCVAMSARDDDYRHTINDNYCASDVMVTACQDGVLRFESIGLKMPTDEDEANGNDAAPNSSGDATSDNNSANADLPPAPNHLAGEDVHGRAHTSTQLGRRIKRRRKRVDVTCRSLGWSILDIKFVGVGGRYYDMNGGSDSLLYSSWNRSIHMVHLDDEGMPIEGCEQTSFDLSPTTSLFCAFSIGVSNRAGNSVIAAGANDDCIYLHDIALDRSHEPIFGAHEDDVNSVCFDLNNDMILYSASDDGLCKIWDLRCPRSSGTEYVRPARPVGCLSGHQRGLTHVESKGDDVMVLTNSKDQSVRIWDIRKMGSTSSKVRTRKDTHTYIRFLQVLTCSQLLQRVLTTYNHDLPNGCRSYVQCHRLLFRGITRHMTPDSAFTMGVEQASHGTTDGRASRPILIEQSDIRDQGPVSRHFMGIACCKR